MKMRASILVGFGIFLFIPVIAMAATDLYIGTHGGVFETALKEDLAPPFEKKFNCKIHYVLGNSSELLAKARIQKDNPQMDAVFVDPGPAIQGVTEGLWDKLDPKIVTNLKNVYEIALQPNHIGVLMGTNAAGILYNTQIFKEKKFTPPASWNDLFRPEFVQRFIMPPITNSFGLLGLVAFAKVNGGGERNIEPGFEAMKKLKKSVISFEPQAGKFSQLFQSKEAWIGIWGSGRTYALSDMGFPVEFVYPKEGAYDLGIMLHSVKNCKNSKLGQEFTNYMLEERSQQVWAKVFKLGPMNKNVKLSPDVASKVPYGLDQIKKLIMPDWAYINQYRAVWTERWSKEVETP